jgi:hypothetical protein
MRRSPSILEGHLEILDTGGARSDTQKSARPLNLPIVHDCARRSYAVRSGMARAAAASGRNGAVSEEE